MVIQIVSKNSPQYLHQNFIALTNVHIEECK
jgi:hypothetical protein